MHNILIQTNSTTDSITDLLHTQLQWEKLIQSTTITDQGTATITDSITDSKHNILSSFATLVHLLNRVQQHYILSST